MGRRSINTTKSGKYMNPTDQARKEARKKELKKNKRQRQMVRAAVLKNKDPSQLLEEMEKIDEMEYNVLQPSPLNEKVLRDKRKKLKETFDRVMRLYQTDEPENWAELKRKEVEYEKRRMKKQTYYESVKHAQSVQVDEIPLPAPITANSTSGMPSGIRMPPPPTALALPAFAPSAPPAAASKSNEDEKPKRTESDAEISLSVPPGPPPDLFQLRELDTDAESDGEDVEDEAVQKPAALTGKKLEDFMRELESEHRSKQAVKQPPAKRRKTEDGDSIDGSDSAEGSEHGEDDVQEATDDSESESESENDSESDDAATKKPPTKLQQQPSRQPPSAAQLPPPPPPQLATARPMLTLPPQIPPPPPASLLYRPPPLRGPAPPPVMSAHGYAMRMPAVPPPGTRHPHIIGMPPSRMRMPMPPGPPPGLPPRLQHGKHGASIKESQHAKGQTTITAKPQIRNLSADVTRFVPSTLRTKRDATRKPSSARPMAEHTESQRRSESAATAAAKSSATKDDAYMQFMNELQDLIH